MLLLIPHILSRILFCYYENITVSKANNFVYAKPYGKLYAYQQKTNITSFF